MSDRKPLFRSAILLLIVVAFACALNKSRSYPRQSLFPAASVNNNGNDAAPLFRSTFVSNGVTRIVHAPSIVELNHGTLRAFWFAGSEEGAGDVKIHSAILRRNQQQWSREKAVQSRRFVQSDLYRYIRRLGNPVAVKAPDGRLWLFFVSTSIGGWSTSSVNMTTSTDGGLTWAPVRRLITSPFFNLSTLVKTVPFFYRDGSLGLPIYHELFAKYGEILHLNTDGKVIEKLRLNDRWRTLQPLVLFGNEDHALALMRYSDEQRPRKAIQVVTRDGGRHWSDAIPSQLPNPDSAIAGVSLGNGKMLVVINNNPVQRDDLTLLFSKDGGKVWHELFRFENQSSFRRTKMNVQQFMKRIGPLFRNSDREIDINDQRIAAIKKVMCQNNQCFFQFDYPYLIRSTDGHFHLLYSWNRTYIKHIEFNKSWLEARLKLIKA